MELNLTPIAGSKNSAAASIALADSVFAREFNETLVHQVVTAYMAKARAGTKAQKTRAEVRGGGHKPWRQKGTGRARAGHATSPIWRAGGVTFAAKPRDYEKKVNKKMYRAAMRSIFSELVRQNRLIAVDDIKLADHKTKGLTKLLSEMKLTNVLVITDDVSDNLYLAARNLYNVQVCDVAFVDPVSLIRFEKVLITTPAIKKIEEQLA